MPWGDYGGTVSVSFACADLKGNSTYSEWSFSLEVPVTLADNILVLGGGVAPASAMSIQSMQISSTEVDIVSVYSDRIVLSYTGDSHGISPGMLLANGDVSNIFYRRVTGIVDNPSTHRVTVYTEDVPFTELITGGSFDSSQFVWVEDGGVNLMGMSPLASVQKDLQYSLSDSFAVNTDWGPVSFSGTAGYALDGKFDFSTEIINMKLTQLSAGVDANLDVSLNGRLVFDGTTAPVDKTIGLCGDGIMLGKATAWIYGIPVCVSVWFDMELCVEAESSGAMTLDSGATANATFSYDVSYSRATQWKQTSNGDFTYTLPPVVVSGGVDAEAYVYVRPILTARLYEALGIEMDYRRGPYVTAEMLAGDGRCQLGLYDKRSVNLGVWVADLPEFLDGLIDTENLPSWPLWSAETPVRVWYYPEVSQYTSPTFTLHPSGGTYASGVSVTLQASASGKPAPS